MIVYHIVLPDVWDAFDAGIYRAASLEAEGFIHCSFEHQLEAVIERYYGGADTIVVLEIETDQLMSRVLNEPSTGNEIYPHIYGPINRDAIIAAKKREV